MKTKLFLSVILLVFCFAALNCSKGNPFSSKPEEIISGDNINGVAGITAGEGLKAEISPDSWSKNWVNSEGQVIVRITGEGFDNIDNESIRMIGPEGAEITPFKTHLGGHFFKAKFYKKEAITLISDIVKGEKHEIQITGNFKEGGSFLLKDWIYIGKKGKVDLWAMVIPKVWLFNWTESEKAVKVKIKGTGFEKVIPESLRIAGGGAEIAPYVTSLKDAYFNALFYQKDAIGLFPNAKAGDRVKIQVKGSLNTGNAFSLDFNIKIQGKKKIER
ncbi:MAG TPA: hypothetical protein ENN61_02210 [Bacteroidaceae bacterium]|nr:hypothetical protein [Bacteroidaceae bacterium]